MPLSPVVADSRHWLNSKRKAGTGMTPASNLERLKEDAMKDFYIQPDAPDPILDESTVMNLVRRHLPEAKTMTTVDESGGEARTYRIDDRWILKTQRPPQLRPRTSLKKEVFFLNQLRDMPDISVPTVLGHGRGG